MQTFDGSLACWILFGAFVATGGSLAIGGLRISSPPMTALGALTAAAALAWSATPALAEDNAEDLVRRAQERGRAAEAALRDWAIEVGRRGEAYEAEARSLAAGNTQQLKRGFSYLASADLFGSAVDEAQPEQPSEGVVYVAVSFSMEPQALGALAAEARAAGAVVVVRGFIGGSVPKTLTAARAAFDENAASGLAIDPQVFRAFGVTRVPTFIVSRSAVQPCEGGIDCTSPAPAHDRLSGNITLTEALRLLAAKGRDAPDVAHSALARLER